MESIDSATIRDFVIMIFCGTAFVTNLLRTHVALKPNPSHETNINTLAERVSTTERELAGKMAGELATQQHADQAKQIEDLAKRLYAHEKRIEKQVTDVHERIDSVSTTLHTNAGKLDTLIVDFRDFRSRHA